MKLLKLVEKFLPIGIRWNSVRIVDCPDGVGYLDEQCQHPVVDQESFTCCSDGAVLCGFRVAFVGNTHQQINFK